LIFAMLGWWSWLLISLGRHFDLYVVVAFGRSGSGGINEGDASLGPGFSVLSSFSTHNNHLAEKKNAFPSRSFFPPSE
jgi:hypothetical protein